MKKEVRTVVCDDDLHIEAHRFEGLVQPFPNHFHEYYVIGFVEEGERSLSCKNQEYVVKKGDILLFNPGDSHACVQSGEGALDYRSLNITEGVLLDIAEPMPLCRPISLTRVILPTISAGLSGLRRARINISSARKEAVRMGLQSKKCVMVIDENLPLGLIANTAAILGITLGKEMPEVVGADVVDQSGKEHLGIIEFPVPILRGSPEDIKAIRERLYQPEFQDLTVVDFSDLAQGCKAYGEFMEKIGRVAESGLQYFGVAICGAKKKVNRLTGNMPLLR